MTRRFRFDLITIFLWLFGGGIILVAAYGAVLTLQQGRISPEAWQSLVIAGIAEAISTAEHPFELDAGFSINGWLAVILTFVLARVFAEGTLMREDLEGTV